MNALLYDTVLQLKLDLRNKNALISYYIIPILFYAVMSSVFMHLSKAMYQNTIISSMTIFAVSMAAFLGAPHSVLESFSTDLRKSYKASKIPLWTVIFTNFISAFINIFVVSLIIYFSAPILFDAAYPSNPLSYFLVLILFISICIVIGILIGMIAKNASVMTMLSQLIFLPSMLLSGIMFPSKFLPKSIITISQIFPATHTAKILANSSTVTFKLILPLIIIGIVIGVITVILYKKFD